MLMGVRSGLYHSATYSVLFQASYVSCLHTNREPYALADQNHSVFVDFIQFVESAAD